MLVGIVFITATEIKPFRIMLGKIGPMASPAMSWAAGVPGNEEDGDRPLNGQDLNAELLRRGGAGLPWVNSLSEEAQVY